MWNYRVQFVSRNAAWPAYQNPRAHISSLTLFPFAVWFWRLSPVSCCKSGSTRTSLQTSVNNDAVMFLMKLCLNDTNRPFLHDKACIRSNFMPRPQNLKEISGMPNCTSCALDSKRVAWSDRNCLLLLTRWSAKLMLFILDSYTIEALLQFNKILSNHF